VPGIEAAGFDRRERDGEVREYRSDDREGGPSSAIDVHVPGRASVA